jgi:WD40 repeat protein
MGEFDAILKIENHGPNNTAGLRVYATSNTGETYGVVGRAQSPDGFGGLFYNNYGIGLAISPDGKQLVTGGPDNKARVWDLNTGNLVATLKDQYSDALHIAFSPDGRVVTVVTNEGLFIYTTRDWKLLAGQYDAVIGYPLTPGGGEVIFSPDGSLAAASYRDKIYFTNLNLGFRGSTLAGFGGPFWEMAVSDDGSTLAVAGQEIYLIDLHSQESKERIDASNGGVHRMAFSPDGQYLAATMNYMAEGCDDWAQIWRVYGQCICKYSRS